MDEASQAGALALTIGRIRLVVTRIGLTILVAVLTHQAATIVATSLWFRASPLHRESQFIIGESTELGRRVGSPVTVGWPLVDRRVRDGIGEVSARLTVRGSRSKGTVRLRAKNRGAHWEYQQLEATVEGDRIDLMPHAWQPQAVPVRGSGQLYFVGIGELTTVDVQALADYYGDRYDVDAVVLSRLPHGARWQPAEELIRFLKARVPEVVADPRSVIIGLTEIDMDWYSWRNEHRFAVVSAAGLSPDQFRRQVSKNVGLLWFELPSSADSRSVLYDTVDGRVDLELMSDDF